MNTPIKQQYKASLTIVGLEASLGATKVVDCIIGGNRKLDGPAYMDGVIKKLYEDLHPDINIVDCRCSVLKIESSGGYFHYTCPTRLVIDVQGKTSTIRDTLEVFIQRDTIEPIPAEKE